MANKCPSGTSLESCFDEDYVSDYEDPRVRLYAKLKSDHSSGYSSSRSTGLAKAINGLDVNEVDVDASYSPASPEPLNPEEQIRVLHYDPCVEDEG